MMATYSNVNHPLPPAPGGGQVQFQQSSQFDTRTPYQAPTAQLGRMESRGSVSQTSNGGRPKSRTLSFKSDKSNGVTGAHPLNVKLEPETHAEKEAKRLHSKADPTMAMFEAEPSAVATTVKSSLAPLRSITHRDSLGNPIAEPDKSNPTRYRWERPLDTIRSFEAAIDGGYNRKSAYQSSDTDSVAGFSGPRRHSTMNLQSARYPKDSYYGGRPQSYMPTSNSAYDLRQSLHGRGGYYDQQGGFNDGSNYGGNGGPNGGRQRYTRMQLEPQIIGMQFNNQYHNGARPIEQNVYPMPSNHRSYETVASGTGSGSSGEAAGYQTDPTSSDNSSIERNTSPSKFKQPPQQAPPPMVNEYGSSFQGLNGGGPQINLNSYGGANNGPSEPQMSAMPVIPTAPIQLGGPGAPYHQAAQLQPPVPQKGIVLRKAMSNTAPSASLEATASTDKRKSWFSRRFSRQQS